MIENQSRWTEVEGGRVHYLIEGHEGGRPVVLLHGGQLHRPDLEQIGTMKALAEGGLPGVCQSTCLGTASRPRRMGLPGPGCGSCSTSLRLSGPWWSRRR